MQTTFWPLASILCGIVFWLVATRGRRGEIVSPFSITLLLLIAIYGVRPVFMIADADYDFYGLSIRSGVNEAAMVGFVAIVTLCGGYFVGRSRPALPEASNPPPGRERGIGGLCVVALVIVALTTLFMAARSGGLSLESLLQGRNDDTRSAVAGVPVVIVAAPAAMAVLVSVARIEVERVRRLVASEKVMFWLVIVLSILPSLGLGNRRFLLPCIVAAIIAVTAPRFNRKVGVRHVGVGVVGFLFLAILPFVRSTGSRQGDGFFSSIGAYFSTNGLAGSLRPFFTSYDTEMFNYVSFLTPRLGISLEYGYGRGTVGDALLSFFPSSIAPGEQWSNLLLTEAFGGGCTSGYCPVPSFVGILLYDFGIVGVAVGSFLLGLLLSRYSRALSEWGGRKLIMLMAFASFTPVLVRGNTINVGWIVINVIVLCLIANFASALTAGRAERRVAPSRTDPMSKRTL